MSEYLVTWTETEAVTVRYTAIVNVRDQAEFDAMDEEEKREFIDDLRRDIDVPLTSETVDGEVVESNIESFEQKIPSDCHHHWVLQETGYVRTWTTTINPETGVITAEYNGSEDFSDGGAGDEKLVCSTCLQERDIPKGTEIDYQ